MNKKTNKITSINNILIIRLSSIGDIILTSPIIRALRYHYPNSTIHYVTFEQFFETIKFNPRINYRYPISKFNMKSNFDMYFEENFADLKKINFDILIDLQNNKYSKKITSKLQYKTKFKINKQRFHKLSMVYLKKPLIFDFNIVENYFNCFENEIIIQRDEMGLEFWFEEEVNYPTEKNRNNVIKNIVSIAPGAAHRTKQWLPKYFAELINLLGNAFGNNIQIQLLGSTKEFEIANYLQTNSKIKINNFVGKTNLVETAKIIDNSDVLITNDTGLMHIAAARQTPIVAIFGSSAIDFGFAPYRVKHIILEKKMWCRPCSHIGRSYCPLLHFNCMKKITPDEVFHATMKFLNPQ